MEIETTKQKLEELLDNVRLEDKKELEFSLGFDYRNKFIKTTLKANEKYFISDKNGTPLAIGGCEEYSFKPKIGQVWLISSKNFTKKNLKLIKFIRNKIEVFKNEYDILFNVIYKSNYKALRWLTKCGFKVMDIKNKNYKLFYCSKGGQNFDLRYITR